MSSCADCTTWTETWECGSSEEEIQYNGDEVSKGLSHYHFYRLFLPFVVFFSFCQLFPSASVRRT